MKTTPLIVAAAVLAGCQQAGFQPGELHRDPAATEFYQMQAHALARFEQKPLVRLVAQPGESITGLESLEVFAPQDPPQVRQYQRQFHPGWQIAGQVLSAAVPLVGMWSISREHRLSQEAVATGFAGLAGSGFTALGQAGQVTADVALGGFDAIQDTAQTGISEAGRDPVIIEQPAPIVIEQPEPIIINL